MKFYAFIAVMAVMLSPSSAQGPDVIIGDLFDLNNYAPAGGFHAYSFGTNACNIGTTPLNWIANTNDHPVIAQQMYRVRDGVFRQIGFAWMKHGFGALQLSYCGPCTPHPNFNALGVGCSDPYCAGLNGQQASLGPRSEVNASTGVFPYPATMVPSVTDSTSARVRVESSLVLNQPASSRFFIEGQYVAKDDAANSHAGNNASYREVETTASGDLSLTGATVPQLPAIYAWQSIDPGVAIVTHDVVGDGRFILGTNAVSLGGGMTRHVFALHNLNSDLAASSISVSLPSGATVSNLQFLDADYHSGEAWSSSDWSGVFANGAVTWTSPDTFASNPAGSALRWGTCHTFVFESDMAPGQVSVGLFKNGSSFIFAAPPVPDWAINGPAASLTVDGLSNNGFTGPIQQTLNFGATAMVNFSSNVATGGTEQDIFYHAGAAVPGSAGGTVFGDGKIINLDLSQTLEQFWDWQTTSSGSFLWTAPTVPAHFAAQMAVTDATAFSSFHVSAALEVAVDPCAFGTVAHTLGDDDTVQVTFGAGGDHSCVSTVSIYGTSHDALYINSNGSVSFGSGSTSFAASVTEFTNQMPRVAGNWSDLNPTGVNLIQSVSDGGGNVVVQFMSVPAWSFSGGGSTVSFDIGFGANGDVAITSHSIVGTWGNTSLTGFSPGGGATGNPVTWSTMIGATTPYAGTDAVYEMVTGGAPSGFSALILHPDNSITVN